ncbi:hypothetical protein PSACC_01149 [Paramicrosporidium saccamoebae]|uniref:TPX2 central domain-containing protein n=1 Tax=Paramicrosporidium saccamoebae TaxID=1246581 RepID=A0A2H9TMU6_9FUNG|nr:hypothetical protein PSACC_01149 [Paramicrosporidium saccamoebae]
MPSVNDTPRVSRATGTPKSGKSNKRYEFSAPQYYDFGGPSPDVDKPHSTQPTPKSAKSRNSVTPRSDGKSPGVPATVTQNRKGWSRNSEARNSHEFMESGQSPTLIGADKRKSDNIFDPEPSPKTRKQASYEKLFEMTRREKPRQVATLGRVRTPDKAMIVKMKTAAPLLPTRSTKPLTMPVEFNLSSRTRSEKRVSFELPRQKSIKGPLAAVKASEVAWETKLMFLEKVDSSRVPKAHDKTSSAEANFAKPFVAKPVDSRMIYGAGNFGVPHVKKTKITVPVDFHFSTTARSKAISTSPFTTTESIPERKREMKLTVPMSPNLSKPTRRIAREQNSEDHPETFKARPAPHSKPFVPVIQHYRTEPHPIRFPGDAITTEKRKRFQETLKREREAAEEARKFHARPAPHFEPDHFTVSRDLRLN